MSKHTDREAKNTAIDSVSFSKTDISYRSRLDLLPCTCICLTSLQFQHNFMHKTVEITGYFCQEKYFTLHEGLPVWFTVDNNNNNNLYSCPEMFTIDKYIQREKLTIKEMSTAT